MSLPTSDHALMWLSPCDRSNQSAGQHVLYCFILIWNQWLGVRFVKAVSQRVCSKGGGTCGCRGGGRSKATHVVSCHWSYDVC
jgi:hypothetical protein